MVQQLWCEPGVQPASAQHNYEWTSTPLKDSHEHCEALKQAGVFVSDNTNNFFEPEFEPEQLRSLCLVVRP